VEEIRRKDDVFTRSASRKNQTERDRLTLFLAWNTIKICGKSNTPMNLENGGRR